MFQRRREMGVGSHPPQRGFIVASAMISAFEHLARYSQSPLELPTMFLENPSRVESPIGQGVELTIAGAGCLSRYPLAGSVSVMLDIKLL